MERGCGQGRLACSAQAGPLWEWGPCDPGFKVGLRVQGCLPRLPQEECHTTAQGTAWWTQGPQKLINALLVTVLKAQTLKWPKAPRYHPFPEARREP